MGNMRHVLQLPRHIIRNCLYLVLIEPMDWLNLPIRRAYRIYNLT